MKSLVLMLAVATAVIHAQTLPTVPGTPQRVIIDTDIGYDIDDAQSVAIALRLRQMAYYNILALTASTPNDKGAAFLNLMLKHGGLTTSDIPIGAYQGAAPWSGSCAGAGDNYANSTLAAKLVAPDPDSVPNVGRSTFPDATAVLRTALANSPNASVVIVTVGGLTNISALMQSAANANGDGFASGATLWSTKVVRMVAQLGLYPPFPYTTSPYSGSALDFNGSCDASAISYVFAHNGSVPIVGAPLTVSMELGGCYDGSGSGCAASMPALSPTRIAIGYFRAAGGAYNLGTGNKGRQYAWDPNAVFYALVGTADPGGGAYNTLSANGTLSITGNSFTWSTATSANHYFAINTSNWTGEQTAMDTLLMDDYVPVAQTHPRLLINDGTADTWDPTTYPGGISGRLSAIAARVNGGAAAATSDWATLRSLLPTGGSPFGAFSNANDEGSHDQVLGYGLTYLLYHKLGNDSSADPYALALYNELKYGTAYGATYPVYGVTQIVVASNVATVTLSGSPGAEITVGASIGVWGCALARDAYCGSQTITGVSGSTFTFSITAANITITDSGMVTTRSYLGADNNGQIGVALSSWAYLYDWCKPWLDAHSHTTEVTNYIKAAYWSATLTRQSSAFSQAIRDADFHNYSVWLEGAIVEAGIALNGDDPLGATMLSEGTGYLYSGTIVQPAAVVSESYTYNIKKSVDVLTGGSYNWEGSGIYSRNAVPRILRAIEALDTFTARASDLWRTQFGTAANFGFYRLYVRDPAGTIANFGESKNLGIYTGKDNLGISIINDRFPDSHFVWMMATGNPTWHDGVSSAGILYKLLFYPYVNGPGNHDLTDLPLSRRFGADVVIRSGWGSGDTMFTLTGGLTGVYHRKADAGSFTLYRGGYLAAAPNYTTVEYPVYNGWLKRTIGSNSITIYDSTDCWIDNIATCGTNSLSELLTNDGGQRTTSRRLNPPFTASEFEVLRTWSGSLYADPTYGTIFSETNNVQFPTLTTGSGYEHVTLDMTKAYTNSYSGSGHNVHAKTPTSNGVVRDVVHFQPVSSSIDPVIIFDKVTSSDASFQKAWTVHTIGPPQVGGSFTTSTPGISSTSNSVMRADNGTARLYVKSLLPAAPTIRAVGGNNCAAKVITSATSANPGVFTIVGHGLTVGERVGIDTGTFSPTFYSGYNSFGVHPAWALDVNELIVSSVVDADHVILSLFGSPWDTTGLPSFTSVFNNSGTGAPVSSGFAGKMYYQSDAGGGNTAWYHNGSAWQHVGENANGLLAPTLYKHTACDYSYWVDQSGPQGSGGANLWVFPQDVLPTAGQPQWRAEVRPSVPATTDYFLNVLTPTSTSDTTGPTTTGIEVSGWHGAKVSDGVETFVAMFAESSPQTTVSYTATHSGGGEHVVAGFAMATPYDVSQGGVSLGTFTSDLSGALRFTETGGGSFVVGGAPGSVAGGIKGKVAASGRVVH